MPPVLQSPRGTGFFPTGTPSLSLLGNYELGVRFFSDIDGTIVGVRFYKPTTDTKNLRSAELKKCSAFGSTCGQSLTAWYANRAASARSINR